MSFMQARSHPNSRYGSQRKRFDGWRHIELAADDKKRGCMFSINLILSVHTYALSFPQDGWVLANFFSIFMDRNEN